MEYDLSLLLSIEKLVTSLSLFSCLGSGTCKFKMAKLGNDVCMYLNKAMVFINVNGNTLNFPTLLTNRFSCTLHTRYNILLIVSISNVPDQPCLVCFKSNFHNTKKRNFQLTILRQSHGSLPKSWTCLFYKFDFFHVSMIYSIILTIMFRWTLHFLCHPLSWGPCTCMPKMKVLR